MQYQELTPTRGFLSSSEYIMHFGLGDAGTVDKVEVFWPSEGRIQILQNVNVNQKLTLKHADAKSGAWYEIPRSSMFEKSSAGIDFQHVEDEFEDFNRERLLPHRFSDLGPSIAVGDANGDGMDDVFIGGAKGQAGGLYIQNNNKFQLSTGQAWEEETQYEDMGAVFFDADGDGDKDLYVASGREHGRS